LGDHLPKVLSRSLLRVLAELTVFALIPVAAANGQGISDSSLPGATTEITGQIRTSDRRAQLSAIIIRLERQGTLVEQSAADGSGNFRFSSLKRGSYTVVIKLAGYAAAQQTVDLQTVSKAHVLLELVPEEAAIANSSESASIDARVPAEARKEYEKGKTAWEARKLNQALEHLDRAVAIYATYFDAQLLRGLSFRELERWTEAEQALGAALASRSETPLALVELGEVYRRTKRLDEAEKVLKKAIAIDSTTWQGHFTLGRVYWETGRFDDAKGSITRAIALNPGYADAHLLAGNVAVRRNDPDQAIVEYETYLKLAPKGSFADQARQLITRLKEASATRKK